MNNLKKNIDLRDRNTKIALSVIRKAISTANPLCWPAIMSVSLMASLN